MIHRRNQNLTFWYWSSFARRIAADGSEAILVEEFLEPSEALTVSSSHSQATDLNQFKAEK